jgi:hypothetical protein
MVRLGNRFLRNCGKSTLLMHFFKFILSTLKFFFEMLLVQKVKSKESLADFQEQSLLLMKRPNLEPI